MDYENLINEQLAAMDLDALEELARLGEENPLGIEISSPVQMIYSLLRGELILDPQMVLSNLASFFLQEIQGSLLFGGEILAVCIILSLLQNLNTGLGEETAAKVASIACSCTIIALSLHNFLMVYRLCENTVEQMTGAMQLLLPIMTPLLLAMGKVTAGSVLNPLILGAITLFATLMQRFVMPALFLSTVIFLGNSLTEREYIKKLAVFLRGAAIFLMGLCITLFSGISALQGLVTRSADGLLMKTARYSMDNFIPVAGRFASDSMDMVLSCTAMIKNGIGIFGVIILICVMAVPLLKMAAVALIYKGIGILAEPMGNRMVSDTMNQVGTTIITLAAVLLTSGILFIIFFAILINLGIS